MSPYDLLTDDDRRRNRDAFVRHAMLDVAGTFGGALGQCSRIREPTDEDKRIATVLGVIKTLLEGVVVDEPRQGKPRRAG